jgi:hypothetical protein
LDLSPGSPDTGFPAGDGFVAAAFFPFFAAARLREPPPPLTPKSSGPLGDAGAVSLGAKSNGPGCLAGAAPFSKAAKSNPVPVRGVDFAGDVGADEGGAGDGGAADAAGFAASADGAGLVAGADAGLRSFWGICGCCGLAAGNSAGATGAVSGASCG